MAGEEADIVFGDFGRLHHVDPNTDELVAVLGLGGRDDIPSDQLIDAAWVFSRDLTLCGIDILENHLDDNLLVDGAGGTAGDNAGAPGIGDLDDIINGDAGDDLILGDAVKLFRCDIDPTIIGGEPGSITKHSVSRQFVPV